MFQFDSGINPVSFMLFKTLPLIIMAVIAFNLAQRFIRNEWGRKRFAVLYMAIALGTLFTGAALIMRFMLPDTLLIPLILGILIVITWKRKAFFPFTLRCTQCNSPLRIKAVISEDSNLCETCLETGKKNSDETIGIK